MTGAGASRKETVHMGNARNRNPCPESAPAPLCRVCSREMDEDTLRTVCIPCSAKAKQDADIIKSLRDTSEFYRKHGGPASDAGMP